MAKWFLSKYRVLKVNEQMLQNNRRTNNINDWVNWPEVSENNKCYFLLMVLICSRLIECLKSHIKIQLWLQQKSFLVFSVPVLECFEGVPPGSWTCLQRRGSPSPAQARGWSGCTFQTGKDCSKLNWDENKLDKVRYVFGATIAQSGSATAIVRWRFVSAQR